MATDEVRAAESRLDRLIREAQLVREKIDEWTLRENRVAGRVKKAEDAAATRTATVMKQLADLEESFAAKREIADQMNVALGALRAEVADLERRRTDLTKELTDAQHTASVYQTECLTLSAKAAAVRPETERLDNILATIAKAERERVAQEAALERLEGEIVLAGKRHGDANVAADTARLQVTQAEDDWKRREGEVVVAERRAAQQEKIIARLKDEAETLRDQIRTRLDAVTRDEKALVGRDAAVTKREGGAEALAHQVQERHDGLAEREAKLRAREGAVTEAEARVLGVRADLDKTGETLAAREHAVAEERTRVQRWADQIRDEELRLRQRTLDLATLERERRGETSSDPEPGEGPLPAPARPRRGRRE